LLNVVSLDGGRGEPAKEVRPDIDGVDPELSFYYYLEFCGALIVFVDSRLNYLANGWFDASEEYIEESFALNLLYLSFVVIGDACRAGHFFINENVFSLNS
jgi:hypothetical protein